MMRKVMREAYGRVRDAVAPGTVLAVMLLAMCPCASALNPSLDVGQYAHNTWRIRDGFAKSGITAIAQTPDGYLWLGTELGVLRFDGVRTVAGPMSGESGRASRIVKLVAARDGTLWIAHLNGLASWKDDKLTEYPEFNGWPVFALIEDEDGAVWAGLGATPRYGRLCAIRKGASQCYGDDKVFGRLMLSLYQSKGNLWLGAGTGLWRWKPDPPKLYPLSDPMVEISDIVDGESGTLLLAANYRLKQLVNGKIKPYPLPDGEHFHPGKLLRDREGSLWIGTGGQGLLHLHQGRIDVYTSTDGLSGDNIFRLFEDREGNIWAATNNGLDRFSEVDIPTISFAQGLSRANMVSVVAARDGSVWIGTFDGLNRWKDGQVTIYRKRNTPPPAGQVQKTEAREINDTGLPDNNLESLYEDRRGRIWVATSEAVGYFEGDRFVRARSVPGGIVNSIVEDSGGSIWIANMHAGLFRINPAGAPERIPWATFGSDRIATILAPDPSQGGLWVGLLRGGVAYWKDGKVHATYGEAEGLGSGRVSDLRFDPGGTLWTSTEGGLRRMKNGRFSTLSRRNGLPCDSVHWAIEDNANSHWLYMACGLVRIPSADMEAWSADPKRIVRTTVYDNSHGVAMHASVGNYTPHVARSNDGKLWFQTIDGIGVIDPARLPHNNIPPPVHIEKITANGKPYDLASGLSLPPLVRDLAIEYTGLSFAAPEKVRFRFKLEGRNRDWQDVGARRQAFYNDLPPRNYRFRVMASNNSGVWNEVGATLDFKIEPAYYQTTWFRLSYVAAGLALLAGLHLLRLRHLAWQFNMRVEERVSERTRIARDLHDTLLQSFQGVLLKFHAVTYLIADRPTQARETLEDAIEQARMAITEGRDAVQGLRSSTVVTNDLARVISTFGEELAADQNGHNPPDFRVQVEGGPRDLVPILRDEVYRIACEALRNAFRHAQARRIEVEIRYHRRQLRLRIRDDGKGVDPKVLNTGGRAGHHGLPGMYERAKLVGGTLTLWSELDSGTEAELTIPGSLAYAKPAADRRSAALGEGA